MACVVFRLSNIVHISLFLTLNVITSNFYPTVEANRHFDERERVSTLRDSASSPARAAKLSTEGGVLLGWREDLQGQKRGSKSLQTVSVLTALGKITGFVVDLYDHPQLAPEQRPDRVPLYLQQSKRNVTVFLGIPYALPPINQRRFKPPLSHGGWPSWSATEYRAPCPQPAVHVQHLRRRPGEDCLYLNIFTPSASSAGVLRPYPVIFYVHGGGLYHGAADNFPAHMLAVWGRVVVVTFNYRLGALGFLSTGDATLPGNWGLLDQAKALHWVYRHIGRFNGDPDRITVMGSEAGAACAGLLAVAPRTAHLVHQVIAEGGSMLADWAVTGDLARVQNTSRLLAAAVGCSSDSSRQLLHCLTHSRTAQEIATIDLQPDVGWQAWSAVIESAIPLPPASWAAPWKRDDWGLLPESPEALLRSRQVSSDGHLHLLTGVNRDSSFSPVIRAGWSGSRVPEAQWSDRMSSSTMQQLVAQLVARLNYTTATNSGAAAARAAISYLYTHWPQPSDTRWISQMYTDIMSDALFTAPMDRLVKLATELGVDTFQFVLNSTEGATRHPDWHRQLDDVIIYYVTGAPFIDQVFYPDNIRVRSDLWTESDRQLSQLFMEALSNFAKYGRPTPPRLLGTVEWPPVLPAALHYLCVNGSANASSSQLNYRQWHSAFWSHYLPTLASGADQGHSAGHGWTQHATTSWLASERVYKLLFWLMTCVCSLMLVLLLVCCCLWLKAKRRADQLYEEAYTDNKLMMRANSNFAVRPSHSASLASMSELNGQMTGSVVPNHNHYMSASLNRADARTVAREIRASERRRMNSRDTLAASQTVDSEFSFRGADHHVGPPSTAPSTALLRNTESRMSTRSGWTAPYATLEHTAPLASAVPVSSPQAPTHVGVTNRFPHYPVTDSTAPSTAATITAASTVAPSNRVYHAMSIPNVLQADDQAELEPPRVRARSSDQLLPDPPVPRSSDPPPPRRATDSAAPPHHAQIIVQMKSRAPHSSASYRNTVERMATPETAL